MPIDVSALLKKTMKATVQIDESEGETVTFEYYPHRVTPAWVAKMEGSTDKPDDADVMLISNALVDMVHSWDLTHDEPQLDTDGSVKIKKDGTPQTRTKPYPIDREHVSGLPFTILSKLLRKIMQSVQVEQDGEAVKQDAE